MASFVNLTKRDLKTFIDIIQEGNYSIKKYLPSIDKNWYDMIHECVEYVHTTSRYEPNLSIFDISAKILYKVTKRHELGDGNKRSAVMATFCFCLVNGYMIEDPKVLKNQAKRIARTKGRLNEELMKKRISSILTRTIVPFNI